MSDYSLALFTLLAAHVFVRPYPIISVRRRIRRGRRLLLPLPIRCRYYNLPSRLCYVLVAWTQPCHDVVVIAFEGERCGQSGMLLSASAACRAGNG